MHGQRARFERIFLWGFQMYPNLSGFLKNLYGKWISSKKCLGQQALAQLRTRALTRPRMTLWSQLDLYPELKS